MWHLICQAFIWTLLLLCTKGYCEAGGNNSTYIILKIIHRDSLQNSSLFIGSSQNSPNTLSSSFFNDFGHRPLFPGAGLSIADAQPLWQFYYTTAFDWNLYLKNTLAHIKRYDYLEKTPSDYKQPSSVTAKIGATPFGPIHLYPVFSLAEEAALLPRLVENPDKEFVGHACNLCNQLFSDSDSPILTPCSCQYLIHQACLKTLQKCPHCEESFERVIQALKPKDIAELEMGMRCILIKMPENTSKEKWQKIIVQQVLERLPAQLLLSVSKDEMKPTTQTYDKISHELQTIVDHMCNSILPEQFPDLSTLSHEEAKSLKDQFRDQFHLWGIFAIVDQQWTRILAECIGKGRCLEVCAGRGWLARALRSHGVSIRATDISPLEPVTTVEEVDAVTETNNIDFLIISWPDYLSPVAANCISILSPETTIIHIGEWQGNGCANDDFFDNVDIIEMTPAPTWPGGKLYEDALYILKKMHILKQKK